MKLFLFYYYAFCGCALAQIIFMNALLCFRDGNNFGRFFNGGDDIL